jgi:hypothetical protein
MIEKMEERERGGKGKKSSRILFGLNDPIKGPMVAMEIYKLSRMLSIL